MNALEKLRQVVDEIHANKDPLKLQSHWDLAVRLISRFPVDQDAAMEAYKAKDLKSEVDAIIPPNEYTDEVWKSLSRAGVLRHTGQGFYELVPDKTL